jgi:hypothetical protein
MDEIHIGSAAALAADVFVSADRRPGKRPPVPVCAPV